jgi:hypothetical protein
MNFIQAENGSNCLLGRKRKIGRHGEMSENRFETSVEQYSNGYYAEKLKEGIEFQDVVTKALYERGIIVIGYSSRRFQEREGENLLGAEIKRDGRFRETGNLYIEIAEKSHPLNYVFIESGIHRKDNSWLFIIGDEKTLYIFSTKYLRYLEKKYPKTEIPTSRAFLMPISDAEKYCLRKIEIE